MITEEELPKTKVKLGAYDSRIENAKKITMKRIKEKRDSYARDMEESMASFISP